MIVNENKIQKHLKRTNPNDSVNCPSCSQELHPNDRDKKYQVLDIFYHLSSDVDFTMVLRCNCNEVFGFDVGIEPQIELIF